MDDTLKAIDAFMGPVGFPLLFFLIMAFGIIREWKKDTRRKKDEL